uniref:P-type domain-containing protein n=1 Tax=Rhodnius prolixus TaxID=13249 RepID=A0ABL0DKX3_RHOPR
MIFWGEYEVLEGVQKRSSFIKKLLVYFLSIGCPLLSFVLLCTFNVWNFSYHYPFVNNDLLKKWNREFGSFVNDYYLKISEPQLFIGIIEENKINQSKLPDPPKPSKSVCNSVKQNEKFDCFPRGSVSKEACLQRGCCYSTSSSNGVPYCFFPPSFHSYSYTSINRTANMVTAEMKLNYNLPYPNISPELLLSVLFVSDDVIVMNILPKESKSLPKILNIHEQSTGVVTKNVLYDFIIDSASDGFQIVRKNTNTSIIDSRDIGGFIYSKQFIQMSSKLPCKHLFGLGEGRTNMPLSTNWNVRTLWNHDIMPTDDKNGYGFYPMYMCLEGGGFAHIASYLNWYSTDFVLQPDALTYRTIGPPLAIAFSLGPSPLQAIQQSWRQMNFNTIIPPFWSLGFHLCRFGYKSVEDLENVWNRTRSAGIPFDTQWVDIDYMENRNDFTLGSPFKNLGKFVNVLHQEGMHFVPILDPGVSGSEPKGTYPPYDRGIEMDIFVKDSNGKKPIIGKVWNKNSTVFPDFTNPKIVPYWIEMLKSFHKVLSFDGLWLDMNEPSNFVNGSIKGCPSNSFEQPPYVPAVDGDSLNYHTLCMSAKHYGGRHYDVHNIYGTVEAGVTSFVLSQIRGKRPFVISRSSTLTIGNYAGHWTGDVASTWDDMAQSVKDIIQMSMYGVNLVGADICGFNGNTTVSMCKRWHQLGAFYPFSRNHNSDDSIDQDPVSLGIVSSTKKVLLLRYSLLPYLYTLFWQSKNNSLPVIRPLFYLFPEDEASYTINSQFMWGDGLLICPVLQEGLTYVKTYLGNSIWYDIYTNEKIIGNSSQTYALAAPEDTIPVLLRAGTVMIMQEPAVTTTLTRKNPFFLKVALNESNEATGMLFWDDGESIAGKYSTIYFGVANNTLMSCNDISDYQFGLFIHRIEIFSLDSVQSVTINQKTSSFNFNSTSKELILKDLQLPMQTNFNVTWY